MTSNKTILSALLVSAMCIWAAFLTGAHAKKVVLGENLSKAPYIEEISTAKVNDGEDNFFRFVPEHLPATVYYYPDTAFGPIPQLIHYINKTTQDTLPAIQVSEKCRMGWKWELSAASEGENVRYFYFSSHENANTEIQPYVCPVSYGDTTATACGSFTWYGTEYKTSGSPTHTFPEANALGCDSIVTLHLTINHSTSSEETKTVCDSLLWNGEWRKESGEYTYETKNAVGCDSTVTLHLTVHRSYHITLPDTAVCDSYVWKGKGEVPDLTIKTTDTYTREFKTIFGCDSIVKRKVTVNHPTFSEDHLSACDSLYWNGKWIKEPGEYTYVTKNAAGCDSTATLYLKVHQSYHISLSDTAVCDSYVWKGKGEVPDLTIKTTGTYIRDFKTVYNCDSIVKRKVTVNHSTSSEETKTVCDSMYWNGEWRKESGEYTYETKNAVGCDSTVTLHLTVHRSYHITLPDTAVCGEYIWKGKGAVPDLTIKTTDTYIREFKTIFGCDSIVKRKVTVNHPTSSEETKTVCDSLLWNGEWRKESTDYTYVTKNAAGCDSTVTLHLTVHRSYHITLPDVKVCDEYKWEGKEGVKDTIIRDTGIYTRLFKTENGCDSIVTCSVTVSQSTKGTDYVEAYDSYTWIDGNTYKNSTDEPTYRLENAAGCDSVVTLNLTIRHLYKDTTRVTRCESEGSYEWRGKEYTKSIIVTTETIPDTRKLLEFTDTLYTLELTVLPVYAVDTFATRKCETFVWHGETHAKSGEYTYEGKTAAGCDSIVTLHLTIDWTTEGDTVAEVCDKFHWYEHECTGSGEYKHTFVKGNIYGADSVVTLHLTIKHSSVFELTEKTYDSYTAPWGEEFKTSGNYVYTTTNADKCDSIVKLHLTVYSTSYDTIREEGCERIEVKGKTYTESCVFNDTVIQASGDRTVITYELTVAHHCIMEYDTVYFCHGLNTPHDEQVDEGLVLRYLPYRYESPNEIGYMEGVVLEIRPDSALVDLGLAETILREYYVNDLTPVERVIWSIRYHGTNTFVSLEPQPQPQWIAAGLVAVQVQFLCGQIYNNSFLIEAHDIEKTATPAVPIKLIENDRVVIIRGGERYSVMGVKMN